MYPRVNYEMSEADFKELLDACKPVPYVVFGGMAPASPQENANAAWRRLGKKMGFDHMTVQPIEGRGGWFFSAVPSETEEQKKERLAREEKERREARTKQLEKEIAERQTELDTLKEA